MEDRRPQRIGQLDLLKRMYGVVVRPQSVLDELNAGGGAYELSPLLEQSDWIVRRSLGEVGSQTESPNPADDYGRGLRS